MERRYRTATKVVVYNGVCSAHVGPIQHGGPKTDELRTLINIIGSRTNYYHLLKWPTVSPGKARPTNFISDASCKKPSPTSQVYTKLSGRIILQWQYKHTSL